MSIILRVPVFFITLYSVLKKCVKVGEGTYGEVYKTNDGVEDVALKVNSLKWNMITNDYITTVYD